MAAEIHSLFQEKKKCIYSIPSHTDIVVLRFGADS